MPPENKVPALAILDDPHAPEFFASELNDVSFDFNNIRLSFASSRFNNATSAVDQKVINVRVVMSIQSAANMVLFLQDFLAKANLNATQKPPDQPMQ